MTRLLPLLFLAGMIAEVASIILVGQALGVFPTLFLLIAGGVAGVSLIRAARTGIMAAFRSSVQATPLQRGAASKALAGVLAGLLFIIPGFFSDFLGLLLLIPAVRQWLRARIPVQEFHLRTGSPRQGETIIEGEAVEIEGELGPPRSQFGQDPRH